VGPADLAALVPEALHPEAAPFLERPGLVLPLMGRGSVFGTLTLLGAEGLGAPDATAALDELAARVGLLVDSTRLNAERTRIADVLRRSLRPTQPPVVPGLRLAAFHRPADDTAGIGGDFYDVHGGGSDWTIVLGDVAGKGVEAAVLTGAVRHSVRTAALVDRRPGRVIALLNDVLLDDGVERFVTLVCGRLRPSADGSWQLDLASAGHPPPLLLRRDGAVEQVGTRGTVVGAVRELEVAEVVVTLDPGDACLLYTDGITESRDHGGALLGRERVAALLGEAVGAEPAAIVEHVARTAIEHGERARDDIAVLAVKVEP
jgi:phosphoserine phosphatase RsbU/P